MILFGRQVLVKQDPARETTASGLIFIPESIQEKERENFGTIFAAGPGKSVFNPKLRREELLPVYYSKGDRVKFHPDNCRKILIDGEELLLMLDSDVYCVINLEV